MKIDIQKAYDSISWKFLEEVLNGLNFPSPNEWVMECVSTPRYSIMVNDFPKGFFEGKRGLRQGDLLSHFLFILCMKYFSRLLNVRTNVDIFIFHPMCGTFKISHLIFADDMLFFSHPMLFFCLTLAPTVGYRSRASTPLIFGAS